MIINKMISLELERIEIVENPINQKGKYLCYQFRMTSPSEYSIFEPARFRDKSFSVVWGRSPTITFYHKDYKSIEKMLWGLVFDDLPIDFPKDKNLFSSVNLQISSWDSYPSDRPWALYYHAKSYGKNGVSTCLQRSIQMNKNTMSRILALIPDVLTQEASHE